MWKMKELFSEIDNSESDSEEKDSNTSCQSWIQWFCRLEGHHFFAEVDEEYIRDVFHLWGLKPKVQNFEKAFDLILGIEPPEDEEFLEADVISVYRDATDLYGLIHARYILSSKGLLEMKHKYLDGQFGYCPRVLCDDQHVLPTGLSDELRAHRVRLYCPRCQECYDSKSVDLDGAFFGTSFAGIFTQTFADLIPYEPPKPYIPKLFGFRLFNKKSIIQHKIDQAEYGFYAQKHHGSRNPAPALTRNPDTQDTEEIPVDLMNKSEDKPDSKLATQPLHTRTWRGAVVVTPAQTVLDAIKTLERTKKVSK